MSPRSKRPASLADYSPAAPTPERSRQERERERRMKAEDALDVLSRAEHHRSDKRLMGDVRKLAAEKAAKMARIAKR